MQRRPIYRLFSLASLSLLAGTACSVRLLPGGSGSESAPPEPEAQRISVDQAFAKVQAGQAVLVDVRGAQSYQRMHAAGALLIPLDEIESQPRAAAAKVPANRQPILYCT